MQKLIILLKNILIDYIFWLSVLLAPLLLWLFLSLINPINNNTTHNLTTIFLIILLNPILEEIVFRGYLQNMLLKYKPLVINIIGISFANLIVSIIFALLHLLNSSAIMAAAILIPSLVFGFFYQRYQSIIPSILLHIYYNIIFLIMVF